MYQLKFNGNVIYDPRDEALIIRNPSVNLAVSQPGSVGFLIDSDHPCASNLSKLKGDLELVEDGNVIYRGRIIRDAKDFDNTRLVESEGLLAVLNDSIVQPFSFPGGWQDDPLYQEAATGGNVIAFFLGWLLANHNSQVENDRKLKLGTVTVTDANNYLFREMTDYANTWAVISDKLLNSSISGYLLIRYENDGNYIDYLNELPLTNTQSVEFGENLLNLSNNVDATNIYTAILPIGADGITIDALPDGDINDDLVKSGKIIYSKNGVAAYGMITHAQKWDDVTDADNLRTKACAMLAGDGVTLLTNLSINACDLHCDEKTINSFRVGRNTLFKSAVHGYDQAFPLLELSIDIMDPANTSITLGSTVKSLIDLNKEQAQSAENKVQGVTNQIKENATEITQTKQSILEQHTSIINDCQSIILTALQSYEETSDANAFKETVMSQLEMLANQLELKFTTVTNAVENVNGDLQSKYNEITKYFRFSSDGLWIGESGNEVLLNLDNDVIKFVKNNLPQLYIDEGGVHASQITLSNRIRIGNAEWVWNGTTKHLSLRKAVT